MKKSLLFTMTALLATSAWGINDGFNFGTGCEAGSGSFEQEIVQYNGDYENTVKVGEIPAGYRRVGNQSNK